MELIIQNMDKNQKTYRNILKMYTAKPFNLAAIKFALLLRVQNFIAIKICIFLNLLIYVIILSKYIHKY